MSSQRYQRVNTQEDDGDETESFPPMLPVTRIPSSPPPPFRSRSSSPSSRRLLNDDPLHHEAEQTLADAFDDGDESDTENEPDDRQRLMRGNLSQEIATGGADASTTESRHERPQEPQIPGLLPSLPSSTMLQGRANFGSTNDGVFANLAAKPETGEKVEDELPPSYEQAAADPTPAYWETTIMAPGMSTNEVYVDGFPVGSVFSFVWNGMISMSFQLVGFLLTYLLHTTHAAKNGSKAGLGLTLVQYGFYMKGSSGSKSDAGTEQYAPPDPNSHDFNPNSIGENAAAAVGAQGQSNGDDALSRSITTSEWISYILMIIGWFILIRSVSEFLRARRHEQLVLQSPDRGLSIPVIAEGEQSETVV